MIAGLASISVIISSVFAVMVIRQYVQRRRPFQLVWGLALTFFAIASLAELVAILAEWTPFIAKTYYFFGATILVGFFAVGTMYLTFGDKTGKISLGVMVVLSITAAALLVPADLSVGLEGGETLDAHLTSGESENPWKGLVPPVARVITILVNSVGSLILIGGAIYSGIMVYRKKHDTQRLTANLVIAAGALTIASGGTLGGLFGYGQVYISLFQTPGIAIMFIGFVLAGRTPKKPMQPVEVSAG